MEEKTPIKLAMVSRLPKFGVRPTAGVTSPLPNGTTPSPQDSKTTPPARPNGVVRASSFSLKWRKDGGSTPTTPTSLEDDACPKEGGDKPKTQHSTWGREIKKPSPSTPKRVRRSGSSESSTSSPRAIPRQAAKTSPKAGSSSPRSSSRDSLSQSSDSLKSLTLDNMVRSQSFTHFKQIPSPTNLPMARSFSFNRAVELAKPLANTQSLSSAGSPSTTPSALKKTLLPNCVLNKPSALGYRLTRPGQVKQQKPLFTGRVKGEVRAGGVGDGDRAESPPLTLTPDPLSDSDRTSGGQLRGTGEGLEDMSLSSASSLSRGDTSEEFLDDFNNLADGDVPDNRTRGSTATQTRLRSFLNETMDWNEMSLSVKCTRGDFLQGSSLELSPSNSSGGTYMWDEEDLEPLGPRTHPCESYDDSDRLNSMDILNNLDPLEPADLEDDDLMLDVDLPEDGSLRTQTTVAPGTVIASFIFPQAWCSLTLMIGSLQILQPSSPSHHEHLTQERLVKTALTEGHSDPQRRRSRGDGSPCTDSDRPARSPARGVDTPPVPNPDKLSVLLSTQLNINDREGSPATGALSRPDEGYANGSLLRSGSVGLLANHRTKQLPPPSRGLPCFNSGPQAVGPSLGRGVLAQPCTLGVRRDLGSTSPPSLEMLDLGLLRARVLVPPILSRLPKPKIH
uniref:Coiled-coil serine rich protein 2 n=1 Tax=Salmo trutta TaxID=8032 RepID=A0A674AY80_SALTR